MKEIDKLIKDGKTLIIGIDGPCGSGKSTLAESLAKEYNCNIVHLDDFFLPFSLRTEERQKEIGGNLHYERLKEEVFHKLQQDVIEYNVFSCKVMDLLGTKTINTKPILIVEGSYSFRDDLISYYDFKIFCDIDKENQKNNIIKRGQDYNVFSEKWIPKEEEYFKVFNIKDRADIVLKFF